MHRIVPDEEKLAELVLYLAKGSQEDPWFGAVKLHKLLYHAEFEAYRQLGRPITGARFQNLEHGPAARRLLPVRAKLLEAGDARLDYVPTPAGVQERLIALREPDLSAFTAEELEIIDGVLDRLRGKTAAEVSTESHEEPGWLATHRGETIPYHMALLSRDAPTDEDREFAQKLDQQLPGVASVRRSS